MTPEERIERVIELMARAALRSVVDEEKEGTTVILSQLLPVKSGPVPFGQKKLGLERTLEEQEAKWISRMEELRKGGLSTEKIAQRLNQEDTESRRAGKWSRNAVWRILKRKGTLGK